jgi:drug/metabolite transporter (DMT)-like permease
MRYKRYVLIFLVLLSSVGFSTKGILAKLAYRYSIDPMPLLTLRMLAAAPFFALVFLYTEKYASRRLTGKEHLGIVVNGFLGLYLSAFLDFKGLTYISAGLERTILFSYPTIVLFLSFILFAKRPTRNQYLAVIVTYVGLAIALVADWNETGKQVGVGALLVFGCAVSFALYMVRSSKYISIIGSLRYTSLALLWATVMTALHTIVMYPLEAFNQPNEVLQIVAIMAIIATVFPSLMLSLGLKHLGASDAAIISSVGPVSTILLSALVLGEPVTLPQVIGAALVIFGVLIIAVQKDNSQKELLNLGENTGLVR